MLKDLFSMSWWRQSLNNANFADFGQRWTQIVTVFNHPRINPLMFLLILAVIGVIVMIAVLTVVMIVSSVSARKDRYALVDAAGKESALPQADMKVAAVRRYRASWKRYSITLSIIAGALLLFIGVGTSTATDSYCKACHGDDKKIAVMQSGSHKKTHCVQCHESGGFVARYSVNSFQRVGHTLTGLSSAGARPTGYAGVPSDACLRCHSATLSGTKVSTTRGKNFITVSHKEPEEAGMACSRCHNLTTTKGSATAPDTMQTCLTCHSGQPLFEDGKIASKDCETCHANDPQMVVASSKPSEKNADQLIAADPKSQCYSCHVEDAASCDSCHGMRIPHPAADFADNHAGAVAQYGLSACLRCHNDDDTQTGADFGGAQSCGQCHGYDQLRQRWDFQN
jgi:hypothetical protein